MHLPVTVGPRSQTRLAGESLLVSDWSSVLQGGGLSLTMGPLLTNLGTKALSTSAVRLATKFSIPVSRPILTQTLNTGLKNGISLRTSALVGAAASFSENMITNDRRGNGFLDGVGRSI